VIVSEETGRISIALDGMIESPFNADQLKTRLKSLITPGAAFSVREARQPASS
jgi:hypothetical protein